MSIDKFLKCGLLIMAGFLASFDGKSQNYVSTIQYKKFSVAEYNGKTKIDWTVDSKTANYFEVQKSFDGGDFKTVMLVLGPDPKDESGSSYECYDKQKAGINKCYYRLKYVDEKGNQQLSDVTMIAFN